MTLSLRTFKKLGFLHNLHRFINCVIKVCADIFRETTISIIPGYKDISEEILLISGGGRGIGRQIAFEFANYKPKHIVLWGRNEDCLMKTKKDVTDRGVACSYYVCDVSSRDQIYSAAESVIRDVGHVSILVNNAGTVHGGHVIDITVEDFEYSLRVNSLAHIWTIKAFLPAMISDNHGHIVCMSSTLGLVSLPGTADYTTSKYALTGLMESLVYELEEHSGIHTTVVHPYQVDNDMFHGCKVRFPWLFPKLTEQVVARDTVSAILRNKKQTVIPWYFNLVVFMKSVLPVSSLYPAFKFLGLHNMMDPLNTRKLTNDSARIR